MNRIIKKVVFVMFILMAILSCEDTDEVGTPTDTIKPTANFTVAADLFQAEQKISFTDLSKDQDGFITSWDWDFGDSNGSTEQSPKHFYAVGGNYEVKLIAADNTGSFSTVYSQAITIADDPLANIDVPETLWSFGLPGKLNHSSPAVADDGTVFIGFNQAIRENQGPDFYAIKNGALVWEQVFYEGSLQKSDEVRSSPAIGPNGAIYSSSYYSRTTYTLNAATGVIDGEINLNARFRYTSPTFATDGTVYIAGYSKDGRGFYSLNPSLTTINWVFKQGEEFNATPAIGADGTIYVGSNNDFFYAINPDGTEKWSAEYGTWTASATAIGPDGTLYFSGETATGGVLIAFNPADGTEKWRNVLPLKAGQGGPAIAADGTIYLGGYEEKMIAYNPTDGSEKWSYTAKGAIETVPAIDNDGNLYFGDTNGFFHVVNSDGLNPYKVVQLGDQIHSSAAIGLDGTIYVAANEGDFGKIYALKTNATSLQTGGWPMFAKDAKHTGR
jgi:outer membrane protein assembly factor BamB